LGIGAIAIRSVGRNGHRPDQPEAPAIVQAAGRIARLADEEFFGVVGGGRKRAPWSNP